MKRILFIILIFALNTGTALAQIDLEKEIMGVRDSSEFIIKNSRQLVNNRLNERKLNDITKIIAYAKTSIDKYQYLAFYPWEEQVLSLVAGDLDYLFIALTDKIENPYVIRPKEDYIGQLAISIVLEEKTLWKKWYEGLDLPEEKKMAVRVLLGAIQLYDDPYENQKVAKSFLKKYPNSEYADFVRENKSSFNTGSWEYEMGGGIWNLGGEWSDIALPNGQLSMGTGGYFNRVYWAVYFMGGLGNELLSPILLVDTDNNYYNLDAGERVSIYNVGLKLGYSVYQSDRVKIAPITYISGTGVDLPYKKGRNEESITINSAFTTGLGVNADFDLIRWKLKDPYLSGKSHLGLRLSAGYLTHLASKKYYDGNSYYCTASLLWWLSN
jgi:hypothetical protein